MAHCSIMARRLKRSLQTGLTAASWPGDTELPLCILRLPLSEEVLGDCWFAAELELRPPMSMWMRRSCRSLSGIAARARSSCVCRARVTFRGRRGFQMPLSQDVSGRFLSPKTAASCTHQHVKTAPRQILLSATNSVKSCTSIAAL